MARVVQKRSGAPYLAIIFIVLCLVVTALAVMFYMNWEESKKLCAELKTSRDRLATDAETRSEQYKSFSDQAPRSGMTIYGQQESQALMLRNKLQPGAASVAQVLQTLDDLAKEHAETTADAPRIDIDKGMAGMYREGNALLASQHERINKLTAEKAGLQQRYDQAAQDAQKASDDQAKALAEAKAAAEAEKKKIEGIHADYLAQLEKVAAEHKKALEDLNKKINENLAAIDKQKLELAKLTDDNQGLRKRVQEITLGPAPTAETKIDGKIMQVLEAERQVYVNLGRTHGVNEGMTLSVYPPSGIPKDGTAKAKLQVGDVFANTSLCRITQESGRDPVGVNDLVANVAYSKKMNYKFVVAGMFDLNSTGRYSDADLKQVQDMITRSGGTIIDDLTYDTDFVVLGAVPSVPARPAEGFANAQDEVKWRQLKKVADDIKTIEAKAAELRVPILNTNRFKDLVGFAPNQPS